MRAARPAKPLSRQLADLRGWRTPRVRDLSLGPSLDAITKSLGVAQRGAASMERAWNELVPPQLAAAGRVLSHGRGVLTVRVPDAAARFALDRWLRAGGQAALAKETGRALRAVKLVP